MLLVFDTSLQRCTVGLGDARGALAAGRSAAMARGQAEALVPMIEETLQAANARPSDIRRVGVTVGPGSFTGVRVGVAAARGLALALGVPAAGFTTLEALAAAAQAVQPGLPVIAAIAARGGQLYHQAFDAARRAEHAPALADAAAAAAEYGGREGLAVGSGAEALAQRVESLVPVIGIDAPPVEALLRLVAESGEKRWRARPAPIYLRPPDARPSAAAKRGT